MAFRPLDQNQIGATSGFRPLNQTSNPVIQPNQSLATRIWADITQAGSNIKSEILRPAQSAEAGASPFEVGKQLAETGLRVPIEALNAVFSPITELGQSLKTATEPISKGIADFVVSKLPDSTKENIKNALTSPGFTSAIQGIADKAKEHPELVKDINAAFGWILAGLGNQPISKAIGDLPQAISKTGEAVKAIPGKVKTGLETVAEKVSPTPTIPEIVGKITQAEPTEIPLANRALSKVNLKGATTFEEVSKKIDTQVKLNTNSVDVALDAAKDGKKLSYLPESVTKTFTSGETTLTHNFVIDGLEQLGKFYEKTNNPKALSRIKNLQNKFENAGLSPKEINNIAREHGRELNAYNASGELASGLTKQAAENTRKGLKDTARELMPDAGTKALDLETSDLIKTKELIDDLNVKAQKLANKLEKPSVLERVGGVFGKGITFLERGFLKGILSKIVPNLAGGEGKMLNPLELQQQLRKNLDLLDELNALKPEEAIKELKNLK